jgi:uncharacterized damage-inducible protein DinB
MSSTTLFRTLFEYKAWANQEVLATIRAFDEIQHAQDRHIAIRLLNHTYVVDRIFAAHLQRIPHDYTAVNTTETPTLDELSTAISASDQWYIDYASGLSTDALSEKLDFTFTDGKPGRMSREEMLAHVVTHGGYHQGQIGWITKLISIKPVPDPLTGYLHRFDAANRRR